jgi:hypothetical protein
LPSHGRATFSIDFLKDSRMNKQQSDFVKVVQAVKSVFHAVTAIRGSGSHETAAQGLTFKHYAIGAAIGAILIISTLVTIVKLVTS